MAITSKINTGKWKTNKSAYPSSFTPAVKNMTPEMRGYFYTGPSLYFGHVKKVKKG